MEKEYLQLLSNIKYYVVYSEKTKSPFLDKDRRVYAFQISRQANEFIKDELGAYSCYIEKEPVKMEQNKEIIAFYSMGARTLVIKQGTDDAKEIPLKANDVPRNTYYNPDLNYHIKLLKETSEKQYMKALGNDFYFIPVSIPDREVGSYPVIYYVDALMRSGQNYVVLFSTEKEFNLWDDKYKKNCKPLEVKMNRIKRIIGKRDIIINPMSDKLFLLNSQLLEVGNNAGDKQQK